MTTRATFWAPVAVTIALGGSLLMCNGVLGIDAASPEPTDGGPSDGSLAFVAVNDCKDYCNDMALACPPGPDQEYLLPEQPDANVCQQLCQFHVNHYDEPGTNQAVDVSAASATPMTDRLYCRVWHAHAALTAPDEHCRHAGPLGGDLCGSDPCDDFCNMAQAFCGSMSYPSVAACLDVCRADGGVGDAGAYPGLVYDTNGADLAAGGNTLNCRIYHLENYLNTGDPVHCAHVAQDGGGVCVDAP